MVVVFYGFGQLQNRIVDSFGSRVVLGKVIAHVSEEGVDYILGYILLVVPAMGVPLGERSVLEKYRFLVSPPAACCSVGFVFFVGLMVIVLFLEISISAIKGNFILNRNKSISEHYLIALAQLILHYFTGVVYKLHTSIPTQWFHGDGT